MKHFHLGIIGAALGIMLCASCVSDPKPVPPVEAPVEVETQATAVQPKPAKTPEDYPLKSACDLITIAQISKIMDVPAASITIKDGSSKKNPHARNCFFRWSTADNPNAGILIQVSENPMPEEFPDWSTAYVKAQKESGANLPTGGVSYKFKDFAGVGNEGAYNFDLSRYCWNTDQEHVFTLAFNVTSIEAIQLIWAEKIGKEITKNFYN